MVDSPLKIKLSHVSKTFVRGNHTHRVLEDLSFSVPQNTFVAILGPSGCGKSTLLNIIAGLETCDQGTLEIDESNLERPERHRMMLFQEAALFPWYNVLKNVTYGLRFKDNLTRAERKEIALAYLQIVGLKHFENAYVHQLSGGMKQRVALARALAPNPQILLMDEPFSALDALTCEQLYKDVQRIWTSKPKTILLVTHNIREAIVLSQRVIILSKNPGKIVQDISIPLPYPRSVYDPSVLELTQYLLDHLRLKQEPIL